ncbi:MAG: tape measure protein [Pseudomonadota bacterium]
MAEIDEVVLKLRADLDSYLGRLKSATKTVDQQLGLQERRVRDLEIQMQRSSGAISSSLKGLAATFATAFTGRELVGLIDGFTRLQNSLKVAGLEGEALLDVQSRLLELSGKYGVSIEALSGLYGNVSQAAGELGATQDQLVQLTEATAQSLLITGTNAQQAQGAILGLVQALGSGVVTTEDFNQINDGGLRPLLKLAANTEKYGGSVSKLKKDLGDGALTSRDFFAAIISGSAQLEGQASKATLTIAGAFEALNSQLTVYVGTAAEANGATAAISGGIQALADNLDVIIPALAVLATAFAGRLVAASVAASAALAGTAAQMGVVGAASFALQARLAGAATSMQALSFAGKGLLATLGGPLGLAITAFAVGLGYVAAESAKTEAEFAALEKRTADLKARLDSAGVAVQDTGDSARSANPLIVGIGNAYKFAGDQAAFLAKNAKLAALATLQADRTAVRSRLAGLNRGVAQIDRSKNALTDPLGALSNAVFGETAAQKSLRAERDRLAAQERDITDLIRRTVAAPDAVFASPASAPRSASAAARGTGSRARARSSSGDLTQADINRASDRLSEAGRAAAESLRRLDQFTQDQFDLATAANENEQDLVRASLALATTREDRALLENRLLDLQASQRQAEQELVLSLLRSTEVQERMAQARLAILPQLEKQLRQETELANQSPGQRFLRDLTISGNNINDQVEGIAIDGLQNLNDQLVDAIFNAESLGDVFSNVAKSIVADLLRIAIQQAVIRPLAENLFGGGGGGGGGGFLSFASSIASIFGRASGGPVAPGQVYRINEGASPGRVEGFVGPSTGGNIVPLGRMDAMRGGVGQRVGGTIRLELSGDIDARIANVSGPIAIEVVRVNAPGIVELSAAETERRLRRPRI